MTSYKPHLFIAAGIFLLVIGILMSNAIATITQTTPGNKTEYALAGTTVGTVAGIGAYLLIGTVGIATGGTGFAVGLPLMAVIGAAGGGVAGAALGKSETQIQQNQLLYSPIVFISLIVIGIFLIYHGAIELKTQRIN